MFFYKKTQLIRYKGYDNVWWQQVQLNFFFFVLLTCAPRAHVKVHLIIHDPLIITLMIKCYGPIIFN
jgi:hypothetical protein